MIEIVDVGTGIETETETEIVTETVIETGTETETAVTGKVKEVAVVEMTDVAPALHKVERGVRKKELQRITRVRN